MYLWQVLHKNNKLNIITTW